MSKLPSQLLPEEPAVNSAFTSPDLSFSNSIYSCVSPGISSETGKTLSFVFKSSFNHRLCFIEDAKSLAVVFSIPRTFCRNVIELPDDYVILNLVLLLH